MLTTSHLSIFSGEERVDGATNVVVEAEKENAVEEPWLDNLDMAIVIHTMNVWIFLFIGFIGWFIWIWMHNESR